MGLYTLSSGSTLPLSLRYRLYARMLMAAQKNVLLVGSPGVGKTMLARSSGRGLVEPVVVVGREGLSYDKLTAYYAIQDGRPRLRPGQLLKAVVSSWLLLSLRAGPRHLIIDEINRCNTDLLLGEAFTAMDIAHRMSTPVLTGEAYWLALDIIEGLAEGKLERAAELGLGGASLDVGELKQAAGELKEKLKNGLDSIGGIPMPYSFRIIATMNVYDRASLYRLGWALQRRFATLYVLPPYEDHRPKADGGEIEDKKVNGRVLDALKNPESHVYRQAGCELRAHSCLKESLVEHDSPTAPLEMDTDEESLQSILKSIPRDYDAVLRLVAYVYKVAEDLNLDLGLAPLVDVVKLLAVHRVSGLGFTPEEVADLALSSMLLPLLGAAAPSIRSELLLVGPESSRRFNTVRRFRDELIEALGDKTLSLRIVESYDLPQLGSNRGGA